ncbi:FAD-binding protein OS=Streptomyces alboniger OX=132473 GN=CP975_27005 PE=4 SV=1 [Streptomyces alboniger]
MGRPQRGARHDPDDGRVSSKALSSRTYTDIPYKVFTSPRRVRFVEMEYAVPRAAVAEALREGLRTMVERSGLRIRFPVEVRTAPADDITLSTASGRDSAYIAVHLVKGAPYQAYFTAAERISRRTRAGRTGQGPHRDAAYLAGVYPRFGEFTALRDRLDPDRRFQNDYLRRVLGA